MINFQIILFFKLFLMINAFGQLTILNSPNSLNFDGNFTLQSQCIKDVVSAVLGGVMSTDLSWPALTISNPFDLPERVIVIYYVGHIEQTNYNDALKMYKIEGNHTLTSMANLTRDFFMEGSSVCDFDLDEFDEAESNFEALFGVEATLQSSEKNISISAAFIESIAENWYKVQDDCKLFYVHTTGTNKDTQDIAEAVLKFREAVKSSTSSTLFLVVTDNKQRVKRSPQEEDPPQVTQNPNIKSTTYYYNSTTTEDTEDPNDTDSLSSTSVPTSTDDSEHQNYTDSLSSTSAPNSTESSIVSQTEGKTLDEEGKKDMNIAEFFSPEESITILFMSLSLVAILFITYAVCLFLVQIDPGKNSMAYRLTEAAKVKKH